MNVFTAFSWSVMCLIYGIGVGKICENIENKLFKYLFVVFMIGIVAYLAFVLHPFTN